LAARPSANLVVSAWQNLTLDWWETRRKLFAIFISELVVREAQRGDPSASARRMDYINFIPRLDITDKSIDLARKIISTHILPEKAADDALHISLAAFHGIDYLLTWNCRHIDNAEIKPGIRSLILAAGYQCPEICTPAELMGGIK
jgi:predicted nucleic acid-binding protein